MKIVKQGILPEKKQKLYCGCCEVCHCQVEEIKFDELSFNSSGIPFIVCPTSGCYTPINCWDYDPQTEK